jgi:hypothetical protein
MALFGCKLEGYKPTKEQVIPVGKITDVSIAAENFWNDGHTTIRTEKRVITLDNIVNDVALGSEARIEVWDNGKYLCWDDVCYSIPGGWRKWK